MIWLVTMVSGRWLSRRSLELCVVITTVVQFLWMQVFSTRQCLISGECFTPPSDTEKISERDIKIGFRETYLAAFFSVPYSPDLAMTNNSFGSFS